MAPAQVVEDPWLEAFRRRCDPLADEAVAEIGTNGRLRGPVDLLEACRALAGAGRPACLRFLHVTAEVPSWVRFEDHAAGRAMFLRNGLLTLLVGFTVLVDTYAGAKDNKVLVLSGRLGGGAAFRRLVETARFTQKVIEEGGLARGAPGHDAALSVRLLHARVRIHCRRAGYDVARYDEPINQEAMGGTLMLFSAGVVLALEKLGVEIADDEKESYHSLFRYVGHLMGVDAELLPETFAGERALYERMKQHQYWPDDDSRRLFEAAVRGVSDGARALPFGLKLLGGGLMQSEAFLREFTAYCVDPRLAASLVRDRSPAWRGAIRAVTKAVWITSRAQRRVPIAREGLQLGQALMFRRVIAALLEDEEARFEDPGFAAADRSPGGPPVGLGALRSA